MVDSALPGLTNVMTLGVPEGHFLILQAFSSAIFRICGASRGRSASEKCGTENILMINDICLELCQAMRGQRRQLLHLMMIGIVVFSSVQTDHFLLRKSQCQL